MPKLAEFASEETCKCAVVLRVQSIGWLHQELFRRKFKSEGILCDNVLAWVGSSILTAAEQSLAADSVERG